MAHVFIAGSSDGLGRMAAQLLVEERHGVVLHARQEISIGVMPKTRLTV